MLWTFHQYCLLELKGNQRKFNLKYNRLASVGLLERSQSTETKWSLFQIRGIEYCGHATIERWLR